MPILSETGGESWNEYKVNNGTKTLIVFINYNILLFLGPYQYRLNTIQYPHGKYCIHTQFIVSFIAVGQKQESLLILSDAPEQNRLYLSRIDYI